MRLLPDGGQQQQGAAATPPTTDAHVPAGSGGATLLHPVQQGVVQDWDALETLLHYVLYDEVRGYLFCQPLIPGLMCCHHKRHCRTVSGHAL